MLLASGCRCRDQPARTDWVDPAQLIPGPVVSRLTQEQEARIKRLQETFIDVDPTPLEKWREDFSRDRDPESELRIYEGMAEAYRSYCEGRDLTQAAKSDVYQVVLLRSGAPDAVVLPRLKLTVLSLDDARVILKGYRVPPTPIVVKQ